MDPVELGKRTAAFAAVDAEIAIVDSSRPLRVGIGSGSTVVYVVERLAERVKNEKLRVLCVPTSFQSTELIVKHGLPLSDLNQTNELDVVIDGADDVDQQLNLIKGGGGCQVQEKIVAASTDRLIIVADSRKDSKKLGEGWKKGVPIEIVPMARALVMLKLKQLGAKSVTLRTGTGKAGPVVSDNGGFIVDADFGVIERPAELENALRSIVGIVETGLFVNMAKAFYIGQPDGTSICRKK